MASDKNTPTNIEECLGALEDNACVAVPFNVKSTDDSPLPTQWQGFEAHDGDIDDRIWLRKPGTVIGLRFKGDVSKMMDGCKDYCIYESGHGRFKPTQNARVRRTKLLFEDKNAFFSQLYREIDNALKRHDGEIAIRMNVFSDIAWETSGFTDVDGKTVFERYPDQQFYDYTKIPKRVQQFLKGLMPDNYYLALSYNKVWYVNSRFQTADAA